MWTGFVYKPMHRRSGHKGGLRERHSWYSAERQARVSPDAEPIKVNLKVEPIPSPQGVMNRRPGSPVLGGNYGHFTF